jgi:hypothetical protein
MESETGQATQAAAWLESSLESFRRDCAAISKNARDTIASDLEASVSACRSANRKTLSAITADLQLIRRLTRFGPWAVMIFLALAIGTTFAASYWWGRTIIREVMSANYQQIGLKTHFTETGLVLTWDETRLALSECRAGERSVPCLIPRARE